MSSPDQDRMLSEVADIPSGRGADDSAQAGAKRAWSAPTVTTFKVTDTRGIFFGSSDGINNLTNEG